MRSNRSQAENAVYAKLQQSERERDGVLQTNCVPLARPLAF